MYWGEEGGGGEKVCRGLMRERERGRAGEKKSGTSPLQKTQRPKLTDRLGRRLPQVPQLHGLVRRARHHLRIRRLGEKRAHGVLVAREARGLHPAPHVPDPGRAIPAPGDQDVERRVQAHAEDPAQVSVVVANHFVRFQVPAFDLLVQGTRKQIRVPVRDGEAGDLLDVSREGEAELARGEVLLVLEERREDREGTRRGKKEGEFLFSFFLGPKKKNEKKNSHPDLDRPVRRTGSKPLVRDRVHRQAANPAQVPRDHAVTPPVRVPFGPGPLCGHPPGELVERGR